MRIYEGTSNSDRPKNASRKLITVFSTLLFGRIELVNQSMEFEASTAER